MLKRIQRFDWLVSLGCLTLLCYFAWHAFEGPRGYGYFSSLKEKAGLLENELDEQKQQQAELQGKVSLMRPEHVDPDMLEELARTQLELSRPNELIVRTQP